MIPVVTPAQMRELDAAAGDNIIQLIGRAGSAVADTARQLLADLDGRRVVVLAGPGNNGADGRVAATLLSDAGYQVDVIDIGRSDDGVAVVAPSPELDDPYDLLIDAAFGTGWRGEWQPPAVHARRVLAVDVPTGLDGLTGRAAPTTLSADVTVTFDAAKPGHFFGDGPDVCGRLVVAPIGLAFVAEAEVVESSDVADLAPVRDRGAHKWSSAVRVVAGQPGMSGAAYLASAAAQRAGAGMVVLSTPGAAPGDVAAPLEVVVADGSDGWSERVVADLNDGRFHALVIGPGLGRVDATVAAVRDVVSVVEVPVVIDGDALFALAAAGMNGVTNGATNGVANALEVLSNRNAATIITPHDGEYRTLTGELPGDERLVAAERLAASANVTVVLKGGPTVIATPGRTTTLVTNGDQRLATAGTGDVLAGVIGAFVASGVSPHDAAVAGTFVHAAAANRLPVAGMVASDLVGSLVGAINDLIELDRS